MTLSLRRFPDRIVRRREAPGDRNNAGEFVPGAITEIELRASVQPLKAWRTRTLRAAHNYLKRSRFTYRRTRRPGGRVR